MTVKSAGRCGVAVAEVSCGVGKVRINLFRGRNLVMRGISHAFSQRAGHTLEWIEVSIRRPLAAWAASRCAVVRAGLQSSAVCPVVYTRGVFRTRLRDPDEMGFFDPSETRTKESNVCASVRVENS